MDTAQTQPDLSVIVPIYNEVENVPPLVSELTAALDGLAVTWEVILVNDGSTDGTGQALRDAVAGRASIRIIELNRNYGQTAALAAGFDHARGRILVTSDGDLQNDPHDIPALLTKLEEGFDVVSGWRVRRQDPFLSRVFPSRLANWLISRTTGVKLHDYGCTLKAYRREVLSDVHLYGEMHRLLPVIASWGGWRITEIPVQHRARRAGRSKYGLSRTFKVILDLATVKFLGSFGTKPIYVFGGVGIACMLAAVLMVALLIYRRLAHAEYMIQSPLLLLSVLLVILAAQSIFLGLLAEMLVRTWYESQGRRIYRVREGEGLPSGPPQKDE